jgi:predicted 3-demethylubiquinone-9 3-methyltransferase (glyoxalase superfamily)
VIPYGRNSSQSVLFTLAMALHVNAEVNAPDFDGNKEAAAERVASAATAWLDDKQGYVYQIFSAYGLPVEKPNSYYDSLFDSLIRR